MYRVEYSGLYRVGCGIAYVYCLVLHTYCYNIRIRLTVYLKQYAHYTVCTPIPTFKDTHSGTYTVKRIRAGPI